MAKVIIEIEDVPASATVPCSYMFRARCEGAPADGSETQGMFIGAAVCRALLEQVQDEGATVIDLLHTVGVH